MSQQIDLLPKVRAFLERRDPEYLAELDRSARDPWAIERVAKFNQAFLSGRLVGALEARAEARAEGRECSVARPTN